MRITSPAISIGLFQVKSDKIKRLVRIIGEFRGVSRSDDVSTLIDGADAFSGPIFGADGSNAFSKPICGTNTCPAPICRSDAFSKQSVGPMLYPGQSARPTPSPGRSTRPTPFWADLWDQRQADKGAGLRHPGG